MQLYFIRHGQSINNANWNNPDYVESPDPVLTELGMAQAQATADHLAQHQTITDSQAWNVHNRFGYGITHIYASLMERAVHTGSHIADKLQVPFAAWEQIHESGGIYGRDGEDKLRGLPGKPRSWYEAQHPMFTLPDSLDGSGWWRSRPHESEEEANARAKVVWGDLLTRHRDQPGREEHRVALVSHGGFFVHLMSAILDLPWKAAAQGLNSWFLLNNCSLTRIDVQYNDVVICYLNRTDHLPDHLISA
jgi:2,3-bisphosphoglycerate-dependent phosphoglycerate mutase